MWWFSTVCNNSTTLSERTGSCCSILWDIVPSVRKVWCLTSTKSKKQALGYMDKDNYHHFHMNISIYQEWSHLQQQDQWLHEWHPEKKKTEHLMAVKSSQLLCTDTFDLTTWCPLLHVPLMEAGQCSSDEELSSPMSHVWLLLQPSEHVGQGVL